MVRGTVEERGAQVRVRMKMSVVRSGRNGEIRDEEKQVIYRGEGDIEGGMKSKCSDERS